MKWTQIRETFYDGTYWILGYQSGDYQITPELLIDRDRPIGYTLRHKGKYLWSCSTLREAKAFAERHNATQEANQRG